MTQLPGTTKGVATRATSTYISFYLRVREVVAKDDRQRNQTLGGEENMIFSFERRVPRDPLLRYDMAKPPVAIGKHGVTEL